MLLPPVVGEKVSLAITARAVPGVRRTASEDRFHLCRFKEEACRVLKVALRLDRGVNGLVCSVRDAINAL